MCRFPIHIWPFNNMIASLPRGEESIIYLSPQMTSQQRAEWYFNFDLSLSLSAAAWLLFSPHLSHPGQQSVNSSWSDELKLQSSSCNADRCQSSRDLDMSHGNLQHFFAVLRSTSQSSLCIFLKNYSFWYVIYVVRLLGFFNLKRFKPSIKPKNCMGIHYWNL